MDEASLKLVMAHFTGMHAAHAVILRVLAHEVALRDPNPRAFVTAAFDAVSLFVDQADDGAEDEFAKAMHAAQRQEIDGFFHALERAVSSS